MHNPTTRTPENTIEAAGFSRGGGERASAVDRESSGSVRTWFPSVETRKVKPGVPRTSAALPREFVTRLKVGDGVKYETRDGVASFQTGPPEMSVFTAELTVESYLNGVRIDSFLEKHFRNYTPWRLQRIIRAGMVKVNDEAVRLVFRVSTGQRVVVRLFEPPDKLLRSHARPLEILHEDPWLIAVNKPPGLVAHPCGDFQSGTLANVIQAHLDRQTSRPGLLRPGIVHRLDRLTSGVILVPKEHLGHRRLSIQFQQERVAKTYVALLDGVVPNDSGVIDLPIGRSPGGLSIMASCLGDAIERQPSTTRYEVLERFAAHTLVKAKPATGRFHQIRVHFATLGFPVTADEYYLPFGNVRPPRPRGADADVALPPKAYMQDEEEDFDDSEVWDYFGESDPHAPLPSSSSAAEAVQADRPLMRRHALHAHQICFTHPITNEWMELTAPLARDMQAALRRLSAKLE